MRKRKKNETSSVDKLAGYQDRNSGKRLKLSERFAEDLRVCNNALEDAQRLLEKIHKRKPPSGISSSASLKYAPTSRQILDLTSAHKCDEEPLANVTFPCEGENDVIPSLSGSNGVLLTPSVTSRALPKHIPTSTCQIPYVADPIKLDDGLHLLASSSPKLTPHLAGHMQSLREKIDIDEEVHPVEAASPMSTHTSTKSMLHAIDMIEDDVEMHVVTSTSPKHAPISVGSSVENNEKMYVVASTSPKLTLTSTGHLPNPTDTMEHDAGVLEHLMASAAPHLYSTPISPKHASTSIHMPYPTGIGELDKVPLEDVAFFPTDENRVRPSSLSPSELHGSFKKLNRSSSPDRLCKLPCLEAVVEASSTLISFFERLTQHGVIINATTASDRVREFLVTKSLANCTVDKNIGMPAYVFADEPKEVTRRDGVAEDQMGVEERGANGANSHFISPQETQDPKFEQDPNFKLEKKESLGGEEPANHEPEKQVEDGEASPNSPLFSTRVFESEEDDDPDGFKQIWDDMELSLACMNEAKRSTVVPASTGDLESCDHNFYKTDDMGMVCSKCGLVGQDPEYIFNYVWGEASNRKRSGNMTVVVQADTVVVVKDAPSQDEEALPPQPISPSLVLHPMYKDKFHVHQLEGFQFLHCNLMRTEPSGCILAHAPGTGKTFLIIAFIKSFLAASPEERPLIVAPKGMLSVWVREFAKWRVDNITIFNLHQFLGLHEEDHVDSRPGKRLKQESQLQTVKQWKAQKSVLLVGYSTFSRLVCDDGAKSSPELRKLLLETPGLLVLDEGHCPRNKRTQILIALSQVRTRRRILLSGTLFQNNFDELYNLYHLAQPDFMALNASCTKSLLEGVIKATSSPAKARLAPSPKAKQRPEREHTEWALFQNLGETIRVGDREQKRHAVSQLKQLSEPFVHWYKGQVLETLPGLVDLTVMLKLTPKQEQALLSLQTKSENALDRSIQSTKVCVHPILLRFDPDAGHMMETPWKEMDLDPRDSSKIMFVLDLLHLSVPMNEKVLLFSQYLGPFIILEKILARTYGWHIRKEILKIEGKTSLEEREVIIDKFNQDRKARILMASIKTCGEGVSLIGASRVVLLDVHFNPAVSRQAVSRAFRIGQRKKVFVYRLVGAGAMEEDAHLKACEKEWLAKQIFEGSNDEDYAAYCHAVCPQEVDPYFESQYLRENVVKCIRYHFV